MCGKGWHYLMLLFYVVAFANIYQCSNPTCTFAVFDLQTTLQTFALWRCVQSIRPTLLQTALVVSFLHSIAVSRTRRFALLHTDGAMGFRAGLAQTSHCSLSLYSCGKRTTPGERAKRAPRFRSGRSSNPDSIVSTPLRSALEYIAMAPAQE